MCTKKTKVKRAKAVTNLYSPRRIKLAYDRLVSSKKIMFDDDTSQIEKKFSTTVFIYIKIYDKQMNERNKLLHLKYQLNLSRNMYRVLRKNTRSIFGKKLLLSDKKCAEMEKMLLPNCIEFDGESISFRAIDVIESTILRIIDSNKAINIETNKENNDMYTFYFKWGFDGTHVRNSMNYKNSDKHEFVMLAMMVPLQICKNGIVLWKNEKPNSNKSCRPISIKVLVIFSIFSLLKKVKKRSKSYTQV